MFVRKYIFDNGSALIICMGHEDQKIGPKQMLIIRSFIMVKLLW